MTAKEITISHKVQTVEMIPVSQEIHEEEVIERSVPKPVSESVALTDLLHTG